MEFVTDTWQTVAPIRIRFDDVAQARMIPNWQKYELRHWLALIGAALLFLAPVAWLVSGLWVSASLLASLGLLMASAATLLVPDEYELQASTHGHDSSQNR
jgi:hypothetical protein